MNITYNNFNNLNFQKTLVAKAGVLTNNQTEDVNIYHLDEFEDLMDLSEASKTNDWRNNFYLNRPVLREADYFWNKFNIYTIENKNKDILCYSIVDNNRANETKLEYIETMPKASCYNRLCRDTKYAGETMLAYHASQLGKKDFTIGVVADRPSTKKFYTHCGFKLKKTGGAIMDNKKAEKLIKTNEKHTGKTIELIV